MKVTLLLLSVLLLAGVAFCQEPENHSVAQPTVTQASVEQPSANAPSVPLQRTVLAHSFDPVQGVACQIHANQTAQPSDPKNSMVPVRPILQPEVTQRHLDPPKVSGTK